METLFIRPEFEGEYSIVFLLLALLLFDYAFFDEF